MVLSDSTWKHDAANSLDIIVRTVLKRLQAVLALLPKPQISILMTLEINSEVIIHRAGNLILIIEDRKERCELDHFYSFVNPQIHCVLCKEEM